MKRGSTCVNINSRLHFTALHQSPYRQPQTDFRLFLQDFRGTQYRQNQRLAKLAGEVTLRSHNDQSRIRYPL